MWRQFCNAGIIGPALSYSSCNWYGQLPFSMEEKPPWCYNKLETPMMLISGIISLIIQKNTLGKNKIRAIFLCPNYVNFFAGKRSLFYLFIYLFIYFLGRGRGGWLLPCPPSPCEYVYYNNYMYMITIYVYDNYICVCYIYVLW